MVKKQTLETVTSDPMMDYLRMKLSIPHVGRIRWVAVTGSDTLGNGCYDNPYKTINFTVSKCTPNNNDVVAIKSGAYDENTSPYGVTVNIPGTIIMGAGNPASVTVRNSKTTIPASKCVFYVSAPNVIICNILINETRNVVTGIQTAAEYTSIQDIIFSGNMRTGIMTFNHTTIRDCWFEGMTYDGIQVNFAHAIIEHNFLMNIGGTAINIACQADGFRNVLYGNVINGAGLTATGIAANGSNNLIAKNVVGGCANWNSDTGTGNIWLDNKNAP